MEVLKRLLAAQIAASALKNVKPEKQTVPFKEHQAKMLKKGIQVFREPGATRVQEINRRKERREAEQVAAAPSTREMFEGKTNRLKTGKYVPAGRFKNVNNTPKKLRS